MAIVLDESAMKRYRNWLKCGESNDPFIHSLYPRGKCHMRQETKQTVPFVKSFTNSRHGGGRGGGAPGFGGFLLQGKYALSKQVHLASSFFSERELSCLSLSVTSNMYSASTIFTMASNPLEPSVTHTFPINIGNPRRMESPYHFVQGFLLKS